jgi:hypothetical protein
VTNKAKLAVGIGAASLAFLAWYGAALHSAIPESPELALKSFYDREAAEDQIMDPLILAGSSVVPLLGKEIIDPGMLNRRYAIGALGNIGNRAVIPSLEKLAREKSEADYIRCDALTAIGMIDHQEGLRVARHVKEDGLDCLSDIASTLDRDYAQWLKSNAPKRTFLQALLGRHG